MTVKKKAKGKKPKKQVEIMMTDVQIGHVISHPFSEESKFNNGKWLVLYICKDNLFKPKHVTVFRIGRVGEDGTYSSSSPVNEYHEIIPGGVKVCYYGYMELRGKLKK